MAQAITFAQAARIMRTFNKEKGDAVLRGLTTTGRFALRTAVTKYMQGLGSGRNARPPNPPPGPLGIRSGNLRRAYGIVAPAEVRGGWTVGLMIDLKAAPYGAAQELGAVIRHPGATGKLQVWTPGLGSIIGPGRPIFRMRTSPHTIVIRARPVAQPAMRDAAMLAPSLVDRELGLTIRRLFG